MSNEGAKRILFLCTGNYYRSRFAEELFNHMAKKERLGWMADSCGLAEDVTIYGNPGPMAKQTLVGLRGLGVEVIGAERMPKSAMEGDFDGFDRIVALSDGEHRSMVRERFPDWESRIDFWQVEDLHLEGSDTAIPKIEVAVSALVERILAEEAGLSI